MIITEIKSMWPEKKGFGFIRRSTGNQYIFLHFLSPVIIETMGKSIRVNPGGCIIYEKFSYQRLSSPECALTHNWFHLKGDLTEISNRYGIEFGKVYYPENDEHITTIIQNMEIEFMNKKSHWEDICRLGCEEIFARLTRAEQKSESPINRIKKETLMSIRTRVHLEYFKDTSVEQMAKEAGMSVSRFHADYSKLFGTSPGKDLINTRIEHAKRMLKSGMTIGDVAEATGFNSTYHFIRQFKKYSGVTPGKYRGK